MNKRQAEADIRMIAKSDSGRVFLTEHAKKRNPKSGKYPLTKAEIVDVLSFGHVVEGPAPDILLANGWKFTMTRHTDGHCHTVVGVLVPETKILVITAFEDRRGRP